MFISSHHLGSLLLEARLVRGFAFSGGPQSTRLEAQGGLAVKRFGRILSGAAELSVGVCTGQ